MKNLVRGLTDSTGREPVFTWFLRADEQIQRLCGEYAWFLRAHEPLLRSLQGSGDELGWHAHFWRRPTESGPWVQELDDVDWQVDMLQRAHHDLATSPGAAPKSVRMGWGYHNSRTYAALESLGIVADLSSAPGFRTLTGKRPVQPENLFDWYCSPELPYRPSRLDYRRPARGQEDSHQLLEVPSFVSKSLVWGLIRGIQLARRTATGAQVWDAVRKPTYFINITGHPRLFAPLATQLRKTIGRAGSDPIVVVTHSHADEFVPNRSRLYSLESVRTNLEALLRVCSDAPMRVEFAQARRVPDLWPDQAVPDRQGPDQRLRP